MEGEEFLILSFLKSLSLYFILMFYFSRPIGVFVVDKL